MTIREYSEFIKNYKIKYNFGLGEDNSKVPLYYFKYTLFRFFKRKIKYTSTQGNKKLLTLIKQKENNYINITEDNIVLAMGSTNALFIKLLSLKEKAKKVLLFAPIYPLYLSLVNYFNYQYKIIDLSVTQFDLSFETFLAALDEKTNVIIINSPNNPTSKVYNKIEISKIIRYASSHHLHLIIDQVYDDIIYKKSKILYPLNDYVTYIKSFSKTYNLTGLRLGYIITSKKEATSLLNLVSIMYVSLSDILFDIAISAISKKSNKLLNKYYKNKIFLENILRKNKLDFINMGGSFYCFINIKKYHKNSYDFALDLLKKEMVNVIPSNIFLTEGYIRLSYACSFNYLRKGVKKFIKYLNDSENN